MRKTLICPKCEGRKLWHIPIASVAGAEMLFRFEFFICDTCGYTEWYAKNYDDVPQGEALKARLIDNERKTGAEGPMR